MNHGEERVLVIHDGSLAAMVACLMAPSLGEVVAWLPAPGSLLRGRGAGEAMQDALAVQQAEILGLGRLVRAGSIAPLPPDGVASGELQRSSSVGGGIWRGMARSIELLLAIAHAREHRCRRVIWPVICDGSIDAMFEVTERATLVTRLAWLDPPGEEGEFQRSGGEEAAGSVRVETPFADLTAEQIAEMASDLDAPVQAAWWPSTAGTAVEPSHFV